MDDNRSVWQNVRRRHLRVAALPDDLRWQVDKALDDGVTFAVISTTTAEWGPVISPAGIARYSLFRQLVEVRLKALARFREANGVKSGRASAPRRRPSKCASLPGLLRDELDRRLFAGATYMQLSAWLKSLGQDVSQAGVARYADALREEDALVASLVLGQRVS